MNRKTKYAFLATALVSVLGFSGAAIAGHGGPRHGHGGHGGGMFAARLFKMVRALDLTEEQEVKAVRLRRQTREEMKAFRKQMKPQMKAAMKEISKENPNREQLHGTVDRMIDGMRKIAHASVDRFLELQATFSPEQRQVIADRVERMEKRREKRQERRRR